MDKKSYEFMSEAVEPLKSAPDYIKKILIKKVYGSFFILSPVTSANPLTLTLSLLCRLFRKEPDPNLLLDVSEITKHQGTFLFPFIKSEGNPFSSFYEPGTEPKVDGVLELFQFTDFFYVCLMPFEGYFILFTNIPEDDIFPCICSEETIKPIELHLIIPRIIKSLGFRNTRKSSPLKELGVYFPLAMLGEHGSLRDKLKQGWAIDFDQNFRNLIRFGLLNYLKLKTDYTVTFYKNNEKNKLNLRGFLYDFWLDGVNTALLRNLKGFLADISSVDSWEDVVDFFWLPLYIISGKYDFVSGDDKYPEFQFSSETKRLLFRINTENWAEEYIVNGIFPQFLKIADNWKFSYLSIRENLTQNKEETFKEYDFELDHFQDKEAPESCEIFLDEIRSKAREIYYYKNEESDDSNRKDFSFSDLFISATTEKWEDCLINIWNPKRSRHTDSRREGEQKHTFSVFIYKLTSFCYGKEEIKRSMDELKELPKNKGLLWDVYLDPKRKAAATIRVRDKMTVLEHSQKCHPTWEGAPRKPRSSKKSEEGAERLLPKQRIYDSWGYIDQYVTREDYVSLCLVEMLKQQWHFAFFGGKKRGGEYRELADIISVENSEKKLKINLFHIKLDPFKSHWRTSSVLRNSFYQYTTVVGQVLEKAKSFIHFKNVNDIIQWLEVYFEIPKAGKRIEFDQSNPDLSSNYCIFETLRHYLEQHKSGEIQFNIFFPVRKKDYIGQYPSKSKNVDLAFETNWRRLKMINDVFEANVGNVNYANIPNLKISLKLGIMKVEEKNDQDGEYVNMERYQIELIDDIGQYMRT